MSDPNILIIRTSAMGDIVMSSPLAEGLRRKYPRARISWLAEPQVRDLLAHNPNLDRVIVWPKTEWKRLFRSGRLVQLTREALRFFRMLRAERFDLALDAQGLVRTRLLACASGATRRIGFKSREPGWFLMTEMVDKGGKPRQMGSEYLHLLETLGCATTDLSPQIHLSPRTREEAAATLDATGVSGAYAVCAPFTTRPQKHWVEANWIDLARGIRERLGLEIVWLGGPADAEKGGIFAREGGGVSLAGRTSLAVSAAVIEGATLVVGVDTGLVHLGTAFRVPTVALFGATRPYLETSSPATAVLYHPFPCSPCRRSPTCDGCFPCMAAISAEEALATASALLRDKGRP
jgi:heptosyltransferase-1